MTIAREETSRLAELLRREQHALAEFLVALSDFDRKQLWIQLGYRSLFDHLRRELGLSKAAAFYRLTAARLIQEHPEVIEPLRDGRLCFSSVVELSKVLTAENKDEVLPRFFHLSKKEAQEVRAELVPAPVVPRRTVVTAVPAATARTARPVVPVEGALSLAPAEVTTPAATLEPDLRQPVHPGEPPAASPRPLVVEPKTAELSRLHLTVPRRLLAKLAAARDALSHSHPGASEDEIVELGLDLILQRHAKRRGLVEKPRKRAQSADAATASETAPASRSRHIPAEVSRAVWTRDGGRCQWPLEGGGVCGSTHRVEIDHIDPFALGGPTTIDRCRVLCDFHNDLAAREIFGSAHMNAFTRPKGGRCSEPIAVYGPAPCTGRTVGFDDVRSAAAVPAPALPETRLRLRHPACPVIPDPPPLEPARPPGYSSAA